MTAVRFERAGYEYIVSFRYDPTLVDLVKTVPSDYRSWDGTTKQWRVWASYADPLARSMRELGHVVTGLEPPPPPPWGSTSSANWALTLFRRVGPTRVEPVHRALTKVLHPDNAATGDTVMQRELNDARADVAKG